MAQINIQISPATFYTLNVLLLGNGPNLPEIRSIEALLIKHANALAHGVWHPHSDEGRMLRLMGQIE